jgi:ABC-type uncharacterized transport system substrate-binding protein
MHRLLGLLVTLTFSLVVALLVAAEPSTRARVAVLGLTLTPPASALPPVVAAFYQALRELGWFEGEHLTIEWRWAEGRLEGFATLVHEVVCLPVDLMVVPNATSVEIAQRVTMTMPIVVMGCGSLAQNVGNLARPGGNITGWRCSAGLPVRCHHAPGVSPSRNGDPVHAGSVGAPASVRLRVRDLDRGGSIVSLLSG